MTPRARELLCKMAAARGVENYDDAEIIHDAGSYWCGNEKTSWQVVKSLLQCGAVSHNKDGGCDHYPINETGGAIVRRPELEAELLAVYFGAGGAFSIRDDRMVPITKESP